MRVLIAHLSDIHIRSSSDPVLPRAQLIAQAIRGVEPAPDLCVLVFSGDIAFSGRQEQYEVALDFIETVRADLAAAFTASVPVHCVLVPGNHDCDLSGEDRARSLFLRAYASGDPPPIDRAIVEICTAVQSGFFQLQSLFDDGLIAGNEGDFDRLYYKYRFSQAGESIVFHCYNTAWLCPLSGGRGALYYPIEALGQEGIDATIAIAVFHHPYGWLPEVNDREFRRRIERTADLIMTGHEHVQERRSQLLRTGERNEYIEGGVLQESGDSEQSTFSVLVLDTVAKRQQCHDYVWREDMYAPSSAKLEWEELQVNRLRSVQRFEVADAFARFLDDPGISLVHPEHGPLRLPEIFVYPDFLEFGYRVNDATHSLTADHFEEVLKGPGHLLITGAEKSGKTSIAKMLFRDLHSYGFVPLILSGSTFKARGRDRVFEQLHAAFEEQFSGHLAEEFRQLSPDRRAIIIDDYHKLRLHSAYEDDFLDTLESFAGKVVFIANDFAQRLSEIVDSRRILEQRRSYRHLRIQRFGYLRRNVLIERWFLLGESVRNDEEVLAHRIWDVQQKIDIICGRNFIPPYPVFILAVLQTHDSAVPIDTTAGTFGYFYELLIRNALAARSTSIQFDIKAGYLAFLAHEMFGAKSANVSGDEFAKIHRKYQETYAQRHLAFSDVRDEMVRAGILEQFGDTFKFKYKYIYYYFVALYLKDHLAVATVRASVSKMATELHVEENANIVLFLAHVSRDPFILDEMLREGARHFANLEPARLEADLDFLGGDLPALPPVSYTEQEAHAARDDRLRELDRLGSTEDPELDEEIPEPSLDEEFGALAKYLAELGAAFKTLQILGQILKNFPGTMEADVKEKLAATCYALGLRSLTSLLVLIRDNREEIARQVMEHLRSEAPETTTEELLRGAMETVFGLAQAMSYATVRRISSAVGLPVLMETYEAVKGEEPSVAVELIDTSLRLDQLHAFPKKQVQTLGNRLEGKFLPLRVLRSMVVNYFYLFPVHFKIKQSVCESLQIPYKRVQGTDPRARLVSERTRPTENRNSR
ncbi:MAG: metallophosphoesterase [Terriglobia bacterium]